VKRSVNGRIQKRCGQLLVWGSAPLSLSKKKKKASAMSTSGQAVLNAQKKHTYAGPQPTSQAARISRAVG
jgi:hypothetical protein